MKKAWIITVVLFISLFFLSPDSASAITLQRSPYLQDVTHEYAYVLWKTDTQSSCEVKWGTTTSYGQTATGATARKTIDNSPGYLCNVKITGLSPGSKYYYQVISGGTGLSPAGDPSYHVNTAPPLGSDTPFTFASIGDPGDCSSGQQQIRDKMLQKDPDFVLIPGDIVYNYGDGTSSSTEGKQDSCLFDMYATLMRNIPFYPTVGNHDSKATDAFVDEMQLPQGGKASTVNSTFSFNWGNHLIVALNSNSAVTYNSSSPQTSATQMKWAYNTIAASNQKWTHMFWHHNCWSRGSHSTGSSMCSGPVKLATDLGVDVSHWGHSHVFERFSRWPATNGGIFYNNGNGGHDTGSPSCGPFSGGPSSVFCSKGEFGMLYTQVNGDTAIYNYVTSNGANQESVTYRFDDAKPQANITPGPTQLPVYTATPRPATPQPTQGGGLLCDVVHDGTCNIFDFNLIVAHFSSISSNDPADANHDGKVDIFDYNIVVAQFGRSG